MNWNEDCNHNIDAASYGFPSMSAAFIPRSTARDIWRFLLIVLGIAGLLGGSFQLIQCSRVISHVINDSRSHPTATHHAHRKDR